MQKSYWSVWSTALLFFAAWYILQIPVPLYLERICLTGLYILPALAVALGLPLLPFLAPGIESGKAARSRKPVSDTARAIKEP
jgi:hypothetical protein